MFIGILTPWLSGWVPSVQHGTDYSALATEWLSWLLSIEAGNLRQGPAPTPCVTTSGTRRLGTRQSSSVRVASESRNSGMNFTALGRVLPESGTSNLLKLISTQVFQSYQTFFYCFQKCFQMGRGLSLICPQNLSSNEFWFDRVPLNVLAITDSVSGGWRQPGRGGEDSAALRKHFSDHGDASGVTDSFYFNVSPHHHSWPALVPSFLLDVPHTLYGLVLESSSA